LLRDERKGSEISTCGRGLSKNKVDTNSDDWHVWLLCYNRHVDVDMVLPIMKKWNNLEDLYELHYQEIYFYLLQHVRQRELAQDLAQDTFLKAFNGLSTFEGRSSVKTWLYRIAHHTFINWYRKESKYSYQLLEDQDVKLEQSLYENPDTGLFEKEKRSYILQLIHELKDDYQHVLILREFQELTYDEIGEILDWKLSKVKTNLHRAKLELKRQIETKKDDSNEMLFD
jgi:RNA polymerase sigma-70 factor (ECF subfamily)